MSYPLYQPFRRQQGTTLVVVLVLILLATIMGLFAVKVNLGEQRASGSDVKTRLMRQAAEAAMAEGMQYVQSLQPDQHNPFATGTNWLRCAANDNTFPCGAVPKCVAAPPAATSGGVTIQPVLDPNDPCNRAAETDPATGELTPISRRSNMFYYTGSTSDTTLDLNGDGTVDAMEVRMLPIGTRLSKMTTTGNGYTVQYGAGALICPLKRPTSSTDTGVACATSATDAGPTQALTVVGVGSMPDENAHVTLTQTIGTYNILNNPPGAPPIVASGTVTVTGNLQIVTNPNGGGPGVPISIWSRGSAGRTGTSNTCYYDEFIRDGAPNGNNGGPTLTPPLNSSLSSGPIVTQADQIIRCDACTCPAADSLSFAKSGNNSQFGIDVLQCSTGVGTCADNGTTQANPGANYNIGPHEFPCDLFGYVFTTPGRKDTNNDNFCEKQIQVRVKAISGPNAGTYYTMGADEAFLYTNANRINPSGNTSGGQPTTWFIKPTQLAGTFASGGGCGSLTTADSGLYWDQTNNCGVGSSQEVGSVLYPLLLVADSGGGNTMTEQGTFFGFIFVRSTGAADLNPATGGTAQYRMNAGSAVYGAVVVQGVVSNVTGTGSIIYNDKVLKNLAKNSIPPAWGTVPGSWSDRFTY